MASQFSGKDDEKITAVKKQLWQDDAYLSSGWPKG
jgi:hypothetical protein